MLTLTKAVTVGQFCALKLPQSGSILRAQYQLGVVATHVVEGTRVGHDCSDHSRQRGAWPGEFRRQALRRLRRDLDRREPQLSQREGEPLSRSRYDHPAKRWQG